MIRGHEAKYEDRRRSEEQGRTAAKAGRCPVNPISEGKEDGGIREAEGNEGSGQSGDRRLGCHTPGSGLHQRCIVGADPEAQKR